jgi:CheY-like chemotaxis protein
MNIPADTILLVEDNPDDVFLMKWVMKKASLDAWNLHVATDGREAIDYLAGNGPYSDRSRFPLPSLILLDLKLPFVNGFEVLEWKRQQEALDPIVVIVLSSSCEARDHEKAYALGVRACLIKPPDVAMLKEALAIVSSAVQNGATCEVRSPTGHVEKHLN